MNIKKLNQILEYLLNPKDSICRIYENAMYSDDLYKIINSLTDIIIAHIYKIIIYSNKYPECVNHWCNEILSFLSRFVNKKLKNKNKSLTTKQIMKIFKDKYIDGEEMKDIFTDVNIKYNTFEDINIDLLYNQILKSLTKLIDYVKSENVPTPKGIEKIIGT